MMANDGNPVSVVSKSHILDRVILAFEALHLNNKANLKIASVPLCCSFTDVCCNISALIISSLTNLNCFNICPNISASRGYPDEISEQKFDHMSIARKCQCPTYLGFNTEYSYLGFPPIIIINF